MSDPRAMNRFHSEVTIDRFFKGLNPGDFDSIDTNRLDEISKTSDIYKNMIEQQLDCSKKVSKYARVSSFVKSNDSDLSNSNGYFKTRLTLAIEKTITSSERIGIDRKNDAEKALFVILTVDPEFEYLKFTRDNIHLGIEALASLLYEKFNLTNTTLLKWEMLLDRKFPELVEKEESKKESR